MELQARQLELELQNEEMRRTHIEIARVRDRLVDLYESAPVGYVTTGAKGELVAANLRFAALLEHNREALMGRRFEELIAYEDQDLYYLHRRSLQEGAPQRGCELRMRTSRGNLRWVALESIVMRNEDGDVLVNSAVIDLTERRRLPGERNQLSLNLGWISEPLWVLDRSLVIAYHNHAVETFLRADPKTLVGKSLLVVVPELAGSTFELQLREAIRSQRIISSELSLSLSPYAGTYAAIVLPIPDGVTFVLGNVLPPANLPDSVLTAAV